MGFFGSIGSSISNGIWGGSSSIDPFEGARGINPIEDVSPTRTSRVILSAGSHANLLCNVQSIQGCIIACHTTNRNWAMNHSSYPCMKKWCINMKTDAGCIRSLDVWLFAWNFIQIALFQTTCNKFRFIHFFTAKNVFLFSVLMSHVKTNWSSQSVWNATKIGIVKLNCGDIASVQTSLFPHALTHSSVMLAHVMNAMIMRVHCCVLWR